MSEVLEINVQTGERIERDFTKAEKKQRDEDEAKASAAAQAKLDKAEAEAEARTAAINHAKSLGFTDEMIAVMYPNLLN